MSNAALPDTSVAPEEEGPTRDGFYTLHLDGRLVSKPDTTWRDDFSRLLFHNERVQVYDFRLPVGESVTIPHDKPTIRWQVDQGCHSLIEQVEQRPTKKISGLVPDRQVFFVPPGTTWQLTNSANAAEADDHLGIYRQIVFILESDKPRYTEQQVHNLFQQAIFSTNVGTSLLLENELVRVWDFYLAPGEGGGVETVHHHCLDYVFINVAPSRLLGLHPKTLDLNNLLFDSISEENQVTWNTIPEIAAKDKSFAHGGKNGYDDRPMREYLIELK
jgi:hypothetical protein